MAASLWDQVLVGLFFVAIAGGLIIAITSTGGELEAAEPSPSLPQPTPTVTPRPESFSFWQRTAEAFERRSDIGQHYAFWCPPGGTLLDAYGTRVYASNSSVCTAAAHWGLINVEAGGIVTIEMRRGRDGHRGSQRNGVASLTLPGSWPISFVFVEPVGR